MPNGYTIVPSNIIGNLTVTGDLDVDTGQNWAIHIGENGTSAVVGFNMNEALAQINAAFQSAGFRVPAGGGMMTFLRQAVGGTQKTYGMVLCEMLQQGSVVNTGNTTENTIYQTTVRGGLLDLNGLLKVRFYENTTVQGAGSSTLRIYLGSTVLTTLGITSAIARLVDMDVQNLHAQNSQAVGLIHAPSGLNPGVTLGTFAVDTSVDQVLKLTCQNANATDSHQFYFMHALAVPGAVSL